MSIDEFLTNADNELLSALNPLNSPAGLAAILGRASRGQVSHKPAYPTEPAAPATTDASVAERIHALIDELTEEQELFESDDTEFALIETCLDNLCELSEGLERLRLSHAEADRLLVDARAALARLARNPFWAAEDFKELLQELDDVSIAVRRLFDEADTPSHRL